MVSSVELSKGCWIEDNYSGQAPFFENDYKEKRELLFIVTPSLLRIRTRGLEPPRLSSLEPETSASTNSATCAFGLVRGHLTTSQTKLQDKFAKKSKKSAKKAKGSGLQRGKRGGIMRGNECSESGKSQKLRGITAADRPHTPAGRHAPGHTGS